MKNNKTIITLIIFCISLIILNKKESIYYHLSYLKDRANIYALKYYPKTTIYKSCKSLENSIRLQINKNSYEDNWSVSILNTDGNVIVDINGNILRIPASNQKLYTTAFALEKHGPFNMLSTKVYSRWNGTYAIKGQGDPDLNKIQLQEIVNKISKYHKLQTPPVINLIEENRSLWWPKTWSIEDMQEAYGPPITRLALTSNAQTFSVQNPLIRFSDKLKDLSSFNGSPFIINLEDNKSFNFWPSKLIYKIDSSPVYSLVNLANAESHNFTSEVLLRTAGQSWNNSLASNKMLTWVRSKGIDVTGFVFADGSGLSRNNKTTSIGITKMLYYMDKSSNRKYYLSSLSLIGVRGTLRNYFYPENIYGNFLGKTGTLNGVRSLSGYLMRNKSPYLYISIIINELDNVEPLLINMISLIAKNNACMVNLNMAK